MQTLESLLRDRLRDSRAMVATLNINAGRVFIDFGQIGPLARIRLRVRGNDVSIVFPEVGDDGETDALLYGVPGGDAPEAQEPAPEATQQRPAPIDPDQHSRAELIAMAEGLNVRVNATKAELAAAINKARDA